MRVLPEVMMQSPGNGPIRWESIAVGLISIATLLLGATAVVEVAQEFGAGGRQELNDFSRNFLRLLFLLNAFSYLIAWGFAFYTIFGETRRKRGLRAGPGCLRLRPEHVHSVRRSDYYYRGIPLELRVCLAADVELGGSHPTCGWVRRALISSIPTDHGIAISNLPNAAIVLKEIHAGT